MLDSTLSKILTTKQVEKQTQVEAEDDEQQQRSESSAQTSSKAEAEVCIVVRFTIEEQIIYKGKIERVHQLESEELSRIVSRVAWDDANDGDKPASTENVACLDQQSTAETTETPMDVDHQHNHTQNSPTVPDRDTSTPIEEQPLDEATESPDHVQENPISNIESSDHKAYTRASADSGHASEYQDDSVVKPEESCTPTNPKNPIECDIKLERSSSPKHIIGTPPSPIQDSDKQQDCDERQLLSSSSSLTAPEVNGSNQHCTDYPFESQTVTDTLNDCVNIVDIESRQEVTMTPKSPVPDDADSPHVEDKAKHIEPLASWPESKQNEAYTFNGLDNNESETTSRRTSSDNSHESCITSELEKPKGNLQNGNTSTKESNNHQDSRNPIEENGILYESDASGSNKRKYNGKSKNASTKRIRRTTSKEQRSLKPRTGAGTNVENTAGRRQSTNTRCSNASLLDNQQPRQNKIFAKWTDNHFYPGTILKLGKDRKYVVGFFDGAQRNVPETDLIPLCNIEGKQVRVSIAKNYCVNAIVHDQRSPVNDQPMFDVEYQQDGVVRKCVPFKDIFLTGEQGTPLISQSDRNSGASNFADVDLDNIIYEKRSRRFQEMEDFELTDNSPLSLSL